MSSLIDQNLFLLLVLVSQFSNFSADDVVVPCIYFHLLQKIFVLLLPSSKGFSYFFVVGLDQKNIAVLYFIDLLLNNFPQFLGIVIRGSMMVDVALPQNLPFPGEFFLVQFVLAGVDVNKPPQLAGRLGLFHAIILKRYFDHN